MREIDVVYVNITEIEWEKWELDECDWFCDQCDASLDDQPGFNPYCGSWTCTECGNVNIISKDNIRMDLPTELYGIPMYSVTSEKDLRNKIEEYLNSTYHAYVADYNYDADLDELYSGRHLSEEDDEYDEDYPEDAFEEEFELADLCRGGGLTED